LRIDREINGQETFTQTGRQTYCFDLFTKELLVEMLKLLVVVLFSYFRICCCGSGKQEATQDRH